jgi:ketosteroid isomerase-like protein
MSKPVYVLCACAGGALLGFSGLTRAVSDAPAPSNAEMQKLSESSAAESGLRVQIAERRKASLEGDVERIANSMVDEYLQTDIYGNRQDKTAWLNEYFKPLAELIKGGMFRWEVYEQKDVRFRFFGDCAVVTGKLELKGVGAKISPQHRWVADPNESFNATLHFTHVYIKRNGKWLLAALHNQLPLPSTQAENKQGR